MCGIAGAFDYANSQPSNSAELMKKMSDVIISRGPDSDGFFLSDDRRCGLTFRRLAIIALSSQGNQPMNTAYGRFSIVFNGEIYNHQEIRNELIMLGYKYRSQTDTETILYGYQQWGADILDKLLGMWAIAIWDDHKKELFISRDRIGIKPLYYAQKNGSFIFGSEIKSILCHSAISRNLNFDELPNYLNYGISSRNGTLFDGIKKLHPASYAIIRQDGSLTQKVFWTPFDSKKAEEYKSFSAIELQNETLSLLRDAVKARMMSDVPFGVFLSGGIDSSVNVALMSELMSRPVDTFTVGFKELEKYNELKYARRIADIFSTNHKEILLDHTDAQSALDSLAFHEDEPNADPVCIPLYFLSKLTRDSGTIVVQVGEGSDEQFAGYPWIIQHFNTYQKYWNKYKAIPKTLRKFAYSAAKPLLNFNGNTLALDYIRRAAFDEEFYWSGVSVFSPSHLELLFADKYRNYSAIPAIYAHELHNEALSVLPDADYYQRMVYLELKQRLAEILLMRVDKVTMAHSIEARVPFLDHRIVEFTSALSANQKMPDGRTTKYILKKASEKILPNDIIYRKKQGFAAPVSEWFKTHWNGFAKDEIYNSFFVKQNIFDKKYIENLFSQHEQGKANNGQLLFSLLMLAVWHKKML